MSVSGVDSSLKGGAVDSPDRKLLKRAEHCRLPIRMSDITVRCQRRCITPQCVPNRRGGSEPCSAARRSCSGGQNETWPKAPRRTSPLLKTCFSSHIGCEESVRIPPTLLSLSRRNLTKNIHNACVINK